MNPKILPFVLMAIDIAAGFVCLSNGDWRRLGYWLCAAGITFFATI